MSEKKTGYDLTKGPVSAHLRRQAIPFSLGLVAIFSLEAIDLFFISQLGDAPLVAVSFALPVIWLVVGIGIGLEAGAASCVSRAVGRKDQHVARRLTTDAVVLSVLVALVMVALGLATIEPVFALLGATPELMPLIHQYMGVWYWVAPLELALWTMLASVRARGNALLESKIVIGVALLNLILDPIFIFGLFGFPRLEVAGAALATVVATAIMTLFSLFYLALKLRVFARLIAPLREVFDSWRELLKIGLPAMLTNAIIPVSSGIVVAMLAATGVNAVAGYGIAVRIEPMALIPFYALSAVSSPFFGQNYSACKFDRLFEARRLVARFCLLFGLCLAAVASLAAPFISSAYTDAQAIREVTLMYIWLVSWSWGAHGIVMSVNASFNGSGRPLPAVVISCLRVIVVLLPLAFTGRWLFGTAGLFAAIFASNVVVAWVAWRWLGRHISQTQEQLAPIAAEPSRE